MNPIRWFCLLLLLIAGASQAQSAGDCPLLPKDSGLTWRKMDGPDFVFCKAIRTSDDAEIFAVTISGKSPFEPKRNNRAEQAVIDSHPAYWYRGEIASAPNTQVRETLIELDNGRVAHISLRASSEAQLGDVLKQAESIRFEGPQLSSN